MIKVQVSICVYWAFCNTLIHRPEKLVLGLKDFDRWYLYKRKISNSQWKGGKEKVDKIFYMVKMDTCLFLTP